MDENYDVKKSNKYWLVDIYVACYRIYINYQDYINNI